MSGPTPEQRDVLEDRARIRVVHAVPGSGKTWLVAELIRRELDTWKAKGSGIAALSFTRVGGEEIRKAVGYEPPHPHFVGTIDAFLFRYVVRPFLNAVFPSFLPPRLVPGEWGVENWGKCGHGLKATVGRGINVFGCVFVDEDGDTPVLAHKPHAMQPLQRLAGNDATQVRGHKKRIWERSGQLTHSDAAFLASKILGHPADGILVRAELIRRFPLVIVDELQDTGYFLGKSIRLLLESPAVRGVLVGDPDQAIYEFNGARPDLCQLFERIAGAQVLPLSNSRRCPPGIARAAAHLKQSGGPIGPAAGKTGRAFLVACDDIPSDVLRIVEALSANRGGAGAKVVARANTTVDLLIGRRSKLAAKLGCQALNHMQRATSQFRQGRQVPALGAVRAAIDLAVFEHEGVTEEELAERAVDAGEWKALAVRCLLRTAVLPTRGNLLAWQTQAGAILDAEIGAFGLPPALPFTPGKLKPQKRTAWNEPCEDYVPSGPVPRSLIAVPVQTVHAVKGETHDVTLFVCPDIRKADRCPSAIWWSDDPTDLEERRIAYVAMTRTQGDLVVCVSNACYGRLREQHADFVAAFKSVTVDEFVAIAQSVCASGALPVPPRARPTEATCA